MDVEDPPGHGCKYHSLAGQHSTSELTLKAYLDATTHSTKYVRRALCSKELGVVTGPALAALIILLTLLLNAHEPDPEQRRASSKIGFMLATAVWICFWWLTGAVAVAITSLIPLFLFPLLGIEDADSVAKAYMNDTIALFLGSFIMALAVEHHGVHKRLALKILLVFGGKNMDPHLLLLGFCVGPAFVSMWISNTAAAAMMIPMAIGVVDKVRKGGAAGAGQPLLRDAPPSPGAEKEAARVPSEGPDSAAGTDKDAADPLTLYCRGVVLAIAYAVAIGGMSTIIGTGPNLVFSGMWKSLFPNLPPVTFLQWFLFAFPVCLTFLLLTWVLISFLYCPEGNSAIVSASLHRSVIEQEYADLGAISFAEKAILSCFSVLALLWVTRSVGEHGWSDLFHGMAGDGTVSIMVAVLLFVLPDGKAPGQKLMSWKACKNLPWDIVLLLGGGFAMAEGIQRSGLSQWATDRMVFLEGLPYLAVAPVVTLLVTLLTQVTSNNSAATIFLPLLAQVAVSIDANPLLFMVPATLGASFAYTLPVSTPPNAIAFATGFLRIKDMAKTGIFLIVIGASLVAISIPTLGAVVFGLSTPPGPLHQWTGLLPTALVFAD